MPIDIDVMTAMAIAVQSNKEAYALLLGSGVSRESQVPTGWEVTLDLIRTVAASTGNEQTLKECNAEPATWFHKAFGLDPNYSDLLARLAGSEAERQALLRRYFEPNAEERKLEKKLPNEAHHSIARLVSEGYIRVILTTNFDHLIEDAISAAGHTPIVLKRPADFQGARILSSRDVFVIKLHGDYLDTKIKNTADELSTYDPVINALLDQIFDEFGLIVCGWSATYDTALRDALARCKGKRFTTFWGTVQEPEPTAKHLMGLRGVREVRTRGAGAFFTELESRILALEKVMSAHPLSVAMAREQVKRAISDNRPIELRDLVGRISIELCDKLNDPNLRRFPNTAEGFRTVLRTYEDLSEIACAAFSVLGYWSGENSGRITAEQFELIANHSAVSPHLYVAQNIQLYAPLLIAYSGCIASLAADRMETTRALLKGSIVFSRPNRPVPFFLYAYPGVVHSDDHAVYAAGLDGVTAPTAPLSQHIVHVLRSRLTDAVPNVVRYYEHVDMLEYIWALLIALENGNRQRGPLTTYFQRIALNFQFLFRFRDLKRRRANQQARRRVASSKDIRVSITEGGGVESRIRSERGSYTAEYYLASRQIRLLIGSTNSKISRSTQFTLPDGGISVSDGGSSKSLCNQASPRRSRLPRQVGPLVHAGSPKTQRSKAVRPASR
ncbi:MAG: SIR2 family protein [Candidatus Binataceae bacterium]|jgi:hypothetical protein